MVGLAPRHAERSAGPFVLGAWLSDVEGFPALRFLIAVALAVEFLDGFEDVQGVEALDPRAELDDRHPTFEKPVVDRPAANVEPLGHLLLVHERGRMVGDRSRGWRRLAHETVVRRFVANITSKSTL